jgi:hypothetical protein
MGVQETKQATANLYRLIENLGTRLGAARTFTDKDLSEQGLQNARQAMAEHSRQTATVKAQKLLGIAQDGAAFAQSKLDDVRPKVDLNDVAQLARARDAWDMVVQPARDKGKSWTDVAANADEDTMLALNRFAEQRIRLDDPNDAPIIISNLRTAIDRRLADTHPDAEARQLFDDARTAADHVVLAQHLANAADSRNAQQVVGALVNAKSYAFHKGIQLPKTPTPTLAELDTMSHLPQYAPTAVD